MSSAPPESLYRFDAFRLDVPNRQLWHGATRLDLNARYFDALVLLVREHGRLVEKDRLFDEVWGDVVVSDAALTQGIKEIRKALGDEASNPRFIETVPRYGYRFIAPVQIVEPGEAMPAPAPVEPAFPPASDPIPVQSTALAEALVSAGDSLRQVAAQGTAGLIGGALAGVFGGLIYGFGMAAAPEAGLGTASVLTVLLSLNIVVGAAGGLGVSLGLAAAGLVRQNLFAHVAGAALGGLLVGSLTKLLGVDAFRLFFGHAPAGITGGLEGAALGAAVGLGLHAGGGFGRVAGWRPVAGAAVLGGVAGALIPLAGGRLMGGSLDLLARSFSESRLHVDALGRFVGEMHFGPTTQVVLGGLEGLLFGGGVAGALVVLHRALQMRRP